MPRKISVPPPELDGRKNRTKGVNRDGTPDKRCLKRGDPGFKERSTDALLAAAKERNEERKAEGKGTETCIFPDPAEFDRVVRAYFDDCDAREELYSEAGLCLWLSAHNEKGRKVSLQSLHNWYDGIKSQHLQETAEWAYLRMQHQIETDPRYADKAMVSYRIFLEKQTRLGGKTDRQEVKADTNFTVNIKDYEEALAK